MFYPFYIFPFVYLPKGGIEISYEDRHEKSVDYWIVDDELFTCLGAGV